MVSRMPQVALPVSQTASASSSGQPIARLARFAASAGDSEGVPTRCCDALSVEVGRSIRNQPSDRRSHDFWPKHFFARPD